MAKERVKKMRRDGEKGKNKRKKEEQEVRRAIRVSTSNEKNVTQ